jgi:hypothetical protein
MSDLRVRIDHVFDRTRVRQGRGRGAHVIVRSVVVSGSGVLGWVVRRVRGVPVRSQPFGCSAAGLGAANASGAGADPLSTGAPGPDEAGSGPPHGHPVGSRAIGFDPFSACAVCVDAGRDRGSASAAQSGDAAGSGAQHCPPTGPGGSAGRAGCPGFAPHPSGARRPAAGGDRAAALDLQSGSDVGGRLLRGDGAPDGDRAAGRDAVGTGRTYRASGGSSGHHRSDPRSEPPALFDVALWAGASAAVGGSARSVTALTRSATHPFAAHRWNYLLSGHQPT